MISLNDLIVLVPELFLTGAICVLLIADLFITQQRRGLTHFLAIGILLTSGRAYWLFRYGRTA